MTRKIIVKGARLYPIHPLKKGELIGAFYFNGGSIIAKIIDTSLYLSSVKDLGELRNGDFMDGELQIVQQFDKKVKVYVNKSYQVSRVDRMVYHRAKPKPNFVDQLIIEIKKIWKNVTPRKTESIPTCGKYQFSKN